MKTDEYRVAVVHAVALNRAAGHDLAILWKGGKIETIQSAPKVVATGTTLALPIVRLLRLRGDRLGNGYQISTTAPPTEACLGMARMCGIENILYLSGGSISKVACKRSGPETTTIAPGFDGPIDNVTVVDNKRSVDVAWHNTPDNYKDALRSWIDKLALRTDHLGTAAKAARTFPIAGGGVVTSTFASSGLEYLNLKSIITDQTVLDNVMMMLAFEMVSQVSGFSTERNGTVTPTAGQRSVKYGGQNIGSLLSDSDGNIIGWGFNTNKENSTRHGEVNLISHFFVANPGENLPNGGTIYTTLEPCEMCSGFIARAVHSGYKFRVIYGQKDDNVFKTALQQNANPAITMTASQAMLATPSMIKSGSAIGANKPLSSAITTAQKDSGEIATTKFLKTQTTYEAFFGNARPQWWLYMWDHLASKLPIFDHKAKADTLLNDPQVMKLNKDLDVVHMLVGMFMDTVRRQGKTE